MHIQISITYRCNLKCQYCFQFFDELPSVCDSDITTDEIIVASKVLMFYSQSIDKVRVFGGEPLLHPEVKSICNAIRHYWQPKRYMGVFTNGIYRNNMEGIYSKIRPVDKKEHIPIMISPYDLGIFSDIGFTKQCAFQNKCGNSFDCFGFTSCAMAPSFGRLFGIDVHHWAPVLFTDPNFCRHCLWSLGSSKQRVIKKAINNGEIEYPSDTFRKALQDRVLYQPKRFLDRIPSKYLSLLIPKEGTETTRPKQRRRRSRRRGRG